MIYAKVKWILVLYFVKVLVTTQSDFFLSVRFKITKQYKWAGQLRRETQPQILT